MLSRWLGRSASSCRGCGKGQFGSECFWWFPHLAPHLSSLHWRPLIIDSAAITSGLLFELWKNQSKCWPSLDAFLSRVVPVLFPHPQSLGKYTRQPCSGQAPLSQASGLSDSAFLLGSQLLGVEGVLLSFSGLMPFPQRK